MSENGEAARDESASGRGAPWKGRDRCGYGHPFDEENTSYRSDSSPGARRCLACKRRRDKDWYARRGAVLRGHRKDTQVTNETKGIPHD